MTGAEAHVQAGKSVGGETGGAGWWGQRIADTFWETIRFAPTCIDSKAVNTY